MNSITTAAVARRDLTGFEGPLIGPEDGDYDEARKVYNAMIDKKRPALIARFAPARAMSQGDRVRARPRPAARRSWRWAQRRRLGDVRRRRRDRPLAAARRPGRSTGADGSGRRRLHLGKVDRATNEHGLATPSGIISTTGVGGLTLGGGIGHLTA